MRPDLGALEAARDAAWAEWDRTVRGWPGCQDDPLWRKQRDAAWAAHQAAVTAWLAAAEPAPGRTRYVMEALF